MTQYSCVSPSKNGFNPFSPTDDTSKQTGPELVENLAFIQQNSQGTSGPAYQIRKEGHTRNPPRIPATPPGTHQADTYRMAPPVSAATNESGTVSESSRVELVATSFDSKPKDASIALAQECAHLLQRKIVIVNHPEANGGALEVTSDNVNANLEPIKIFYNQKKGCYEGYENGSSKTVLGKSGSGSIQEAILASSSPTTITYEGLMAALYTARLANVIGAPINILINDSLEYVYRPKKKSDKNPITIVCKDKYSFSGVFNGQIAPTKEEPMFDSIARAVIIAQRGDNPTVTESDIKELRRKACRTVQKSWQQLWKSTVSKTELIESPHKKLIKPDDTRDADPPSKRKKVSFEEHPPRNHAASGKSDPSSPVEREKLPKDTSLQKNNEELPTDSAKRSAATLDDTGVAPSFDTGNLHTDPLESTGADLKSKTELIESPHKKLIKPDDTRDAAAPSKKKKVSFQEHPPRNHAASGKSDPSSPVKRNNAPTGASLPKNNETLQTYSATTSSSSNTTNTKSTAGNTTATTTTKRPVVEKANKHQPSGLVNYGHTCFINSLLQSVADSWQASGILDSLRDGRLPEAAMDNLLDDIIRNQNAVVLTGAPDPSITRREQARMISTNPDRLDQLPLSSEVQEGIEAYRGLAATFVKLCDSLNRGASSKRVDRHYRKFLNAYKRFGEATNSGIIRNLLNSSPAEDLNLERIQQQDPHEFLSTLTQAMGLNQHPILHQKDCTVHSISRSFEENFNINVGIADIARNETVPNAKDGSADLGVTHGYEVSTIGTGLPRQLTVKHTLYEGTSTYLREGGNRMLRTLPEDGILRLSSSQTSGTNQHQSYKVRSVICHRGESMESGHYITLLFKGDDIVVCDDQEVLPIARYAVCDKSPCKKPYTSFADFCERDGLTAYMVIMDEINT